jgi:hypothetical protein
MVAVIALLASRRRLIRQFDRADAYTASGAIPLVRSSALHALWLSRLGRAQVIRSEIPDRYWLDRAAWLQYRDTRRRRGIVILLILATVLLGLLGLGIFRPRP